ncbi:MAG: DUF4173 domain-containing protein [Verrucomicrobiales bacterium]|nr:DUF4173 domain-containing protein [Verrucomicrobiales bacterium]
MNPRTRLALAILAISLSLGILGDLLLRTDEHGLNLTLWLSTGLLAAAALATLMEEKPDRPALGLAVVAFGFAGALSWRASPTLEVLNFLSAALLAACAAARAHGHSFWRAGLAEQWARLVRPGLHAVAGVLAFVRAGIQLPPPATPGKGRVAVRAVAGVVIALPLLLVFGGLFMEADLAFRSIVERLLDIDLALIVQHVVFTLWLTWLTSGALVFLLLSRPGDRGPLTLAQFVRLGPVEIGVALALVNLLFLGFILVQVRYLFGNADLVRLTPGLTYAEYARHGFFQLVVVVAIALPMLLVGDWLLAESRRRAFRAQAALLVVMLGVVLVSAGWRMRLYQQAYGWTEQRFYVTAFLLWLAVTLGGFAFTVLRDRRDLFAGGGIAAGLAFVLALNLINPDAWIARRNLQLALRTGDVASCDTEYLGQLGADAFPVLVEALPDLPPAMRSEVEARLVKWQSHRTSDWRAWNWGRHRATTVLARAGVGRGDQP